MSDFGRTSRIIVIGTSSAGKSTFARKLSERIGCRHIELDELFWGPDWQPKSSEKFLALVQESVSAENWVADGNYSSARKVVWEHATGIVWLNYPLLLVLWRGLTRASRRIFLREEMWHGNRESFRRTFLSKDSILIWILSTHRKRAREFEEIRSMNAYPNAKWYVFNDPHAADEWLETGANEI
jgi:adenylate kinase family enzyme